MLVIFINNAFKVLMKMYLLGDYSPIAIPPLNTLNDMIENSCVVAEQ